MRVSQNGFMMFEFMIYLALMAITSVLVGMLCTNFFATNAQNFRATDTALSLYAIAAHIARDIYKAPVDKRVWKEGASSLAWQGAQQHAWKLEGKRIMRTEGHEVAALADGIDGLEFQLSSIGSQVVGVRYTLRKEHTVVSRYVPLYERVFVCTS